MIDLVNDLLAVIYFISNLLSNPYIFVLVIAISFIYIIKGHNELKEERKK